MRDYAEIIPIYEERWAARPDSHYFLPLANAYRAVGQPSKAIEVLQRGLERYPDYLSARAALVAAYLDAELHEEAEEEARVVLAAHPENLLVRRLLVDCYRESGRVEEALSEMKHLLEAAPGDDRIQGALQALESYMAEESAEELAEEEAPGEAPVAEEPLGEEPPEAEDEGEPYADEEVLLLEEEVPPRDFEQVLAEVGLPGEREDDLPQEEDTSAYQEEEEEEVVLEPAGAQEEETPREEGLTEEVFIAEEEPPETVEEEEASAEELAQEQEEEVPPEPTAEAIAEGTVEPRPTATLAELYAVQGHLEEAAAVYRKLLERDPDNQHHRQRLGELEAELEASQQAEAETPAAAEVSPETEPDIADLEALVDDEDAVRAIHSLFPSEADHEGSQKVRLITSLEGWLEKLQHRPGPESPAVDIP